ncbi:secondary thiamine-phosphate synthase [Rhodanobacter sp. FW510-R12]|uniref:secondary thiamine-phosphate synthase enzyme YjbQ n=1 Tax=unclassified Rhodanobacter TaxID=2621553 RepID=UPI0007AA2DF4|nr:MULTISPECIES: secondary thiamine-phosphate synthase enzyme YjbQ [unclassified Rhodanobacter]KZC16782.1 secondary thiamine-phosphate synthase [Rhodanobacter sp. FW104-R8]KZC27703.1 secondary thiamine-phosphate synthase [Rhodanobacter sp. FW510-T8]KZC33777.1 secondary thiamine-phosphate synthase [Rhodanobacter sp. FW510-R10]
MTRALPAEHVAQGGFTVHTRGRGFSEITVQVGDAVAASHVQTGIAQVFTAHTSCSLLISENADPAVRDDLERWFARTVPDGDAIFQHDAEGPDDMPAHVRSILTGVSLTVPVHGGKLMLGAWQGIYLWEHRIDPHQRKVVVTVLGN